MKLSKRFIAAILCFCMLLTAVPALATTEANVRDFGYDLGLMNEAVTIDEIPWLVQDAEHMRLVTNITSNAEFFSKFGIDVSGVTSGVPLVLIGTENEGLVLSGKIELANLTYSATPANNKQSGVNDVLSKKGPVSFKFTDVKVKQLNKSSSGRLIFEIALDEFYSKVTDIKTFNGTIPTEVTEDIAFTDADVISGGKTAGDVRTAFANGASNKWLGAEGYAFAAVNVVVNDALENKVDMGPFPADTQFMFMESDNLYNNGVLAGWETKIYDSFSVYQRPYIGTVPTDAFSAGPFTVVVPKFSGTYNVFALKRGHKNGKVVSAHINSERYIFREEPTAEQGWDNVWSKESEDQTVTFVEGIPVFLDLSIERQQGGTSGALIALAFVPVTETVTLTDENRIVSGLEDAILLRKATQASFVNQLPKSTQITVKYYDKGATEPTKTDDAVYARPYWIGSQVDSTSTGVNRAQNILGEPTGQYVALHDALQFFFDKRYTDVTWDSEKQKAVQVYVNGEREYDLNFNMLLKDEDVVEIKNEDVTTDNFAPFSPQIGRILTQYQDDLKYTALRLGVNVSSVPFDFLKVNATAGGKLVGSMSWTGNRGSLPDDQFAGDLYTGHIGEKNYFYADDTPVKFATMNNGSQISPMYGLAHVTRLADNVSPLITVSTPTGEKQVFDPHKVYLPDSSSDSSAGITIGLPYYNTENLYWVNNSVTDQVKYYAFGDKHVLRCDGFNMVRVMTKTAAGASTVRVELLPNKPYVFEVNEGETVYVWEDTPYAGSTLKPLLPPITKQQQ